MDQLRIKEVPAPADRHCSSGHTAPETFCREGAGTPALPTRFFEMPLKGVMGTFCEPCLIVSNWYGRLIKVGKAR